MIKLSSLLKEILLNEYNKSQLEYIASKLGIERNNEFDALMNALDAQGIKYPDLKTQISNGEIKSLEDLKALKKQSKADVTKAAKSDSKIVYDADNIFVVVPYTHAASCYYGKGTKWCTTDKNIEYWAGYIKLNQTLYYIINKNLPESDVLHKVAILVNDDNSIEKVFNAKDSGVNKKEYFKKLKDQIGYDLRDKINFTSKSEIIKPITLKQIEREREEYIRNYRDKALKILQNYIDNGSKGDLIINFPITSLPPNLVVGEDLYIRTDTLNSLPSNLTVNGDLLIENSPISTLPQDIKVGKDIYAVASDLSSLPDNLEVNGNLYLNRSAKISKLPKGLKVKNNLGLDETKVTLDSLPEDLMVGGTLFLNKTPLSKQYDKDELIKLIKRQYPGVNEVYI